MSHVFWGTQCSSNFGLNSYHLWDITHKATKYLVFPTPPLFDTPLTGNPLEFLNETYPAKTNGMGLLYSENGIILTYRFWLIHPCDGRTDRWMDNSIYCRPWPDVVMITLALYAIFTNLLLRISLINRNILLKNCSGESLSGRISCDSV